MDRTCDPCRVNPSAGHCLPLATEGKLPICPPMDGPERPTIAPFLLRPIDELWHWMYKQVVIGGTKTRQYPDPEPQGLGASYKAIGETQSVFVPPGSAQNLTALFVSTTALHAVRRWCSADGSPQHERTTAGKVGESLEPGGSGAIRTSLRNAMRRHGSGRHQSGRETFLRDGRATLCSNNHQEASIGDSRHGKHTRTDKDA